MRAVCHTNMQADGARDHRQRSKAQGYVIERYDDIVIYRKDSLAFYKALGLSFARSMPCNYKALVLANARVSVTVYGKYLFDRSVIYFWNH